MKSIFTPTIPATLWYVQGDVTEAYFATKIESEAWARIKFPDDSISDRDARIHYLEQDDCHVTRGLLIDPFCKTVWQVYVMNDTLRAMYRLLGVDCVNRVGLGRFGDLELDLWVDDVGYMTDWDDQKFFDLGKGYPPLAGFGIVFAGDREGDTVGLPDRITAPMLQASVSWPDAKDVVIPAPRMQTLGKDGQIETTLLAGCENWTYENQPY